MAGKKTFTGADLKAFMLDESFWDKGGKGGKGYYIEEDLYFINGKEMTGEETFEAYGENFVKLDDDAKVRVDGYLLENSTFGAGNGIDFSSSLRKWVDANSKQRLIATFELDKNMDPAERQKLVDTLTSLGAKISGITLDAEASSAVSKKPKIG